MAKIEKAPLAAEGAAVVEPVRVSLRYVGLRMPLYRPVNVNSPGGSGRGAAVVPEARVGWQRHPCVPASTMRGGVRRVCHGVAVKGKVSVEAAYMNMVGGVKGSDPTINDPALKASIRQNNPLLDLFGGADPYFLSSAVQMGDLRTSDPVQASTYDVRTRQENGPIYVFGGVRRNPVLDGDIKLRDLSGDDAERIAIKQTLLKQRAPFKKIEREIDRKTRGGRDTDLVKSLLETFCAETGNPPMTTVAELAARIATIDEEIKKTGLSTVSEQLPLDGYERIGEGTEMDHTFRVVDVPMDRHGLFLAGFERWVQRDEMTMGGKLAQGCGGGVTGTYTVYARIGDEDHWTEDCAITVVPGEPLRIKPASGDTCVVLACREAWANADKALYDFEYPDFSAVDAEAGAEPAEGAENAGGGRRPGRRAKQS